MATVEQGDKSVISSEAFDVLDCFASGLDDVVYHVAEQIARQHSACQQGGTVVIEKSHVREAVTLIFDLLKQSNIVPPEAKHDLQEMETCFRQKCSDS